MRTFVVLLALHATLTPRLSMAPATLVARVTLSDAAVTADTVLDCDSGFYSRSTWDVRERAKELRYKGVPEGRCTLTLDVYDQLGKRVGRAVDSAEVVK